MNLRESKDIAGTVKGAYDVPAKTLTAAKEEIVPAKDATISTHPKNLPAVEDSLSGRLFEEIIQNDPIAIRPIHRHRTQNPGRKTENRSRIL